MYQSTMTNRGQITIPAEIREKLHLTAGNKLEFLIKGEQIIILPINKSIRSLKGILPKPDFTLTCNEMNQVIKNAAGKKI
ncbi:MAG: AbrB/MazE/SpoVT family DNA-binding domain-containing protein [Alphaproteobacteria bacterium]|nr:AbrB/MazE/SpoVT family DNA-binding domain-containing protein [Alphaproteobacteria bacterium]